MTKKLAKQLAKDYQRLIGKRVIDIQQKEPAAPVLSVEPFMKNTDEWDIKIQLQHKPIFYYELYGGAPKYKVVT
jgi:hypothetical protein